LAAGVPRIATRADVGGIQRVRAAVRENRLVSLVIPDGEVIEHLESLGRGWVVEEGGEIAGFAIGRVRDGNIWALFVDPAYERRGHGRRLHDEVLAWMFEQGLDALWLTTQPATRAERFYRTAGWTDAGLVSGGRERRFEMARAAFRR
jgi:GNAT superfamily N-acetyltransferase